MKQRLLFSLRVIVLAILGAVTFPAVAQTTAQGFYYPPPAWDLKLQCDTHATCPRFVVLSNWIDASHPSGGAAVLDRETGLVWERSPSTSTFMWPNAQLHCISLNAGNRGGWHLPTIQELRSLVNPSRSNPALPAGHQFSNVQSSFYWSATTRAANTNAAWVVNFSNGVVDVFDDRATFFVWCVRGGQGVDSQ
jgi:hypothetical protein